ncbi:YIP1 family protein [Octadecabacter sp. CECT 8868]|uniref:YIP1 family protein n=1 Tax=Octadecabacter algicola TaxID=2909342 RepID=UPI001F3FA724|nr:YIP1 family protein [Octadecabacter algicola]MCF2904087.1 YIP1 family protein [Octadecabacter algicola]
MAGCVVVVLDQRLGRNFKGGLMDLTFKSMLEWVKLTIRNPRMASSLVKEARLPLEVSIILIVLAGVVSGITFGIFSYAFEAMLANIELAEPQITPLSQNPLTEGVLSSLQGIALAFAVHRIGAAMGGQGGLNDIMAVTAVIQLVAALIFLVVIVVFFIEPILGGLLALFGGFVFLRGLGNAVNVGHDFNNMGKTVAVIVLSFLAVYIFITVLSAVFGLGPDAVVAGETL